MRMRARSSASATLLSGGLALGLVACGNLSSDLTQSFAADFGELRDSFTNLVSIERDHLSGVPSLLGAFEDSLASGAQVHDSLLELLDRGRSSERRRLQRLWQSLLGLYAAEQELPRIQQ